MLHSQEYGLAFSVCAIIRIDNRCQNIIYHEEDVSMPWQPLGIHIYITACLVMDERSREKSTAHT